MQKGDKLKIFPDTDINAYINYFHSEGLRTRVSGDYILITGYCSRRRAKKEVGARSESHDWMRAFLVYPPLVQNCR